MKRRIALSLDKELLDQIDALAAQLRRTRTSIIVEALEDILDGPKTGTITKRDANRTQASTKGRS